MSTPSCKNTGVVENQISSPGSHSSHSRPHSISSKSPIRVLPTPGVVMNLENIEISVDARRRELLEARFFDPRGMMQPLVPVPGTQLTDSNLSAGSHHSSGGSDDNPPPLQNTTPEKSRTPSGNERKRKRKPPPVDHNDNSGQGPGKSSRNDKKISEYFKAQGSPGRGTLKTPSPQNFPPMSFHAAASSMQLGGPQEVPASPTQSLNRLVATMQSNAQIGHRFVQTDMTCLQLQNIEEKSASDLNKKDGVIVELQSQNEELKRQLTAQNKLLEKHKDNINRCIAMTKQLLIAKVKDCM